MENKNTEKLTSEKFADFAWNNSWEDSPKQYEIWVVIQWNKEDTDMHPRTNYGPVLQAQLTRIQKMWKHLKLQYDYEHHTVKVTWNADDPLSKQTLASLKEIVQAYRTLNGIQSATVYGIRKLETL